jgi:hypothetical protein
MGSKTPSSVPGVLLRQLSPHSVKGVEYYSRSIPGKEVVTCLRGCEFAHRRKHTESIASKHDDVRRLTINGTRNVGIRNVLDRVSAAGVLGNADVIVVGHARNRVVHDILEDATETDGIEDLGFLFSGKVDAFGVAAALDVEDTGV